MVILPYQTLSCSLFCRQVLCLATGRCVDREGNCVEPIYDDDWYANGDSDEWYDDDEFEFTMCRPGEVC